ncbi:hypothetical protein ACT6QH_04155 [Xanthobacter sp. TB0139]|uniref:hypothetical protein n=1 Tax=Xanthobacter sp. TB0139 TaxID=3459178 RepID=UPI00403A5C9D
MKRSAPHKIFKTADPRCIAGIGFAVPAAAFEILLLLGFLTLLAGEMVVQALSDSPSSVHLPVLPWISAMAVMLPGPLHVHDFSRAQAGNVDFARIRRMSLYALPWLLERWLPGGRVVGLEYVIRNPTRADRHPGSFRINLHTGVWADFATDDRGGDLISLHAYLTGRSQIDAARDIAQLLDTGENSHAR